MLKKDLRKGHVSECHVCSARVLGSQVFIASLSAPQPVEKAPNYSRSGLTIPRSSAGPALLQPLLPLSRAGPLPLVPLQRAEGFSPGSHSPTPASGHDSLHQTWV